MKTFKASKYPNGYLPKIAYHLHSGNVDKAQYFINRQEEMYGKMNADDHAAIAKMYNELEAEA